jgi:hypothetical protein
MRFMNPFVRRGTPTERESYMNLLTPYKSLTKLYKRYNRNVEY